MRDDGVAVGIFPRNRSDIGALLKAIMIMEQLCELQIFLCGRLSAIAEIRRNAKLFATDGSVPHREFAGIDFPVVRADVKPAGLNLGAEIMVCEV